MPDPGATLEQARQAWQAGEPYVPLALAAALALHEAAVQQRMPLPDSPEALDLAAAALSRVVTICALHPRTRHVVPLEIDLASGRFADGATLYKRRYGAAVEALVVRRDEVDGAMDLVREAGLSLFLPIAGR